MNAKKKALGRGLDALLADPNIEITEQGETSLNLIPGAIANIPVARIKANPYQPRTHFDEIALDELCQSIKKQGLIQPITVRKLGYDKYQLISGERRLRASSMAGLIDIPAYIRHANDQEMLEMSLVENIQRQDLNAIEIAITYERLMDECQLTQEALSERLGKNRTTVANYLRLLKLPAEIQVAIRDEKISMGHARALINISTLEAQLDILQLIINKDLSVRDVERLVRDFSEKPNKFQIKKETMVLPSKFQQFKMEIAVKMDSKVEIVRNAKGKGKLMISFDSDSDFEKIMEYFK